MSLKDTLQTDLKIAMKAKDSVRLTVIRSLMTEIKYEEISSGNDLLP